MRTHDDILIGESIFCAGTSYCICILQMDHSIANSV